MLFITAKISDPIANMIERWMDPPLCPDRTDVDDPCDVTHRSPGVIHITHSTSV